MLWVSQGIDETVGSIAANATNTAATARRLLPRDFAEQLRIDEYAARQTATTATTTEYRPVSLDKIPVPSSGGNLTGKYDVISYAQLTTYTTV